MQVKMKIEKIMRGLIGGVIGIVLGFLAGGILAYPIALLMTPEGQDPSLAWLFVFALITSQLGMILVPYIVIRVFERKKKVHNQMQNIVANAPNSDL